MEILTEFDELQAALAKVNMDESVLPYVKGRLVLNENAYNKTQKILNCPEMIAAHKYLYELDMDQLTEDDTEKIDKLYDVGVKRGFIIDDLTDWDAEDGEEDEIEDEVVVADVPAAQRQPQNTLFKAKIPCWTVIYSATKDGDIKTGEAYSNAVSMTAAKADVNAKLSQCGYDNITILAIENCMNAPKTEVDVQAVDVSEADDEEKEKSDDSAPEDTSDKDASSNEESDEDTSSDEDASDEDTSDEDTSSNEESDEDTSSDEDASDEDTSDKDASDEDTGNEESDEASDEDAGDEDTSSNEDTSDEEDVDDEDSKDSEKDEDSKELDANEKAELRDLYRKTFRNTLVKCKFDVSFNDLTLEQKVKFFTELSKAWDKENEPQDFMTRKELEQLDNVVVKNAGNDKDDESSDEDDNAEETSDEE